MMQSSSSSESDESALFDEYDELAAEIPKLELGADDALSAFGSALDDSAAVEMMQRNMNESCDEFVKTFLTHDGSISELHRHLKSCETTISEVQASLHRYLRRIENASRDIGALQVQARRTSLALMNTLAIQRISENVLNAVFVPPDALKVILSASDHEVGTQFVHEVKRLGEVLLNRRRGYVVLDQSTTPQSIMNLTSLPAYIESIPVISKITAVACLKITNFIRHKIDSVLGKGRTNIAVLQQNVLKDYRPLMIFLRDASVAFDDPLNNPAAVFFEEIRRHYSHLLGGIYLTNIKAYVLQCNALEIDWKAKQHPTTSSQSTSVSSGFSSMFASVSKHTAVSQPVLTERSASVTGEVFGLGARGAILANIRATPVIPIVARRQNKRHSYEETFRSLQVILTDAVTSEFLFSFDFFGGDSSVYVDIFKPTVQFVVDYVAEVVLRDSDVSPSASSVNAKHFAALQSAHGINTDYCGLLILIRLVHLFKVNMHQRKLYCLDGYFDSLLLTLWPAFKIAFDRQLNSIRTCTVQAAYSMMSIYRDDTERLRAIHPITPRYANLSLALLILSGDIENTESPIIASHSNELLAISNNHAEDVAESLHRFAVLKSNLGYVRVEFERIIRGVGEELARCLNRTLQGFPAPVVKSIYLINNYYAVLSTWCSYHAQYPSLETASTAHPSNGPPSVGFEEDDDDDFDSSIVRHLRLTKYLSHAADDFENFYSAYVKSCREVAVEVIQFRFPELLLVIKNSAVQGENYADVARIGKAFSSSAKDDVAWVANALRSYIPERKNTLLVLKHTFSELLMLNSSFHKVASKVLDGGKNTAALRSIIVTNQELMVFMKQTLE